MKKLNLFLSMVLEITEVETNIDIDPSTFSRPVK